MRLIDADETIKAIEEVKKIMNEEIKKNDRKDLINFVNGLNQACICVEQQPTVGERPKGEWMDAKTEGKYYCSACGGEHCDPITGKWREVFDYKYAFCPLCGADMKGEEE